MVHSRRLLLLRACLLLRAQRTGFDVFGGRVLEQLSCRGPLVVQGTSRKWVGCWRVARGSVALFVHMVMWRGSGSFYFQKAQHVWAALQGCVMFGSRSVPRLLMPSASFARSCWDMADGPLQLARRFVFSLNVAHVCRVCLCSHCHLVCALVYAPSNPAGVAGGGGLVVCCDVVVYHHPGNKACLPVTTP